MARGKRMGSAARRRWLGAGGLLVGLLAIGAWWQAGAWLPQRATFPVQGIEHSASDGVVNFAALKADGADFVYLRASDGAKRRDAMFAADLANAREAGLQVGAILRFDPCADAGPQAAQFVTTVPRDAALLPPAIELDLDDTKCAAPPAEAAMASELTTLLNQVEAHAGRPAILKLSRGFEKRYRVAGMVERTIWATGGWWPLDGYLAPGYSGRPWVMWTANPRLRSPASDERLHWVVVRP